MSGLRAGFCRLDITPPFGTKMTGFPRDYPAKGILDSLTVTAVVFDNGEKRALVVSADLVGIEVGWMNRIRALTAEAIGTEVEAVFICCTHTHTGPGLLAEEGHTDPLYAQFVVRRIRDAAVLAAQDLAPAKLLHTAGEAKNVAFIRRFLMKNGVYKTNPGRRNPDIVRPIGEPDERASLLIIKRENAPEIGIVNFQVHADVIDGRNISADYPHFVRETYERIIDNSRCMYINGAQGDTNDVDVHLPEGKCGGGYERAKYMGRKIAMAALANYELAEPVDGEDIAYVQRRVCVRYNKGTPEQIADSVFTVNQVRENQANGMGIWTALRAAHPRRTGIKTIESVWEAKRILRLTDLPDEGELYVSAVRVGGAVFAGFPGECFTEMGREVKRRSGFTHTISADCANGYEGYFPLKETYGQPGGYERASARYAAGTAETLVAEMLEAIGSL